MDEPVGLNPGQYLVADVVSGSIAFGGADDQITVLEDGFEDETDATRTQDSDLLLTDRTFMGRDFITPGTVGFTLGIGADTAGATWNLANTIATFWDAQSTRTIPGATQRLWMNTDGRLRYVDGRTRDFKIVKSNIHDPLWIVATAKFRRAHRGYYDSAGTWYAVR